MKIIKSYIIQFSFIIAAAFMFLLFTIFFIKNDKCILLFVTLLLGILFAIMSTSRIEYDENEILIKVFIWTRKITIKQIKSITYSGIPHVCTVECLSGDVYMPLFYPRKKIKELFELAKRINPSIKILKQ